MSTSRQLISCPACTSMLIQIDGCGQCDDATTVLERRCPECGHEDEMVVAAVVAEVLSEHAAALTASLHELADRLEAASELWISG
ncbi:MAG: hypothetical protein QOC86_585 [Gaiellales bacterium]|nr:hypothetical protein [Gaiellales bacterium]